jgi:probable rRNA maturation factor
MPPFAITKTVKSVPSFPYETMKNDVLGKKYNLALTFVGPTRAQKLNEIYRKKTYTPNVLSFPLEDDCGEIVICPDIARREASAYNQTKDGHIAFLFIHGLLHLKGYDHQTDADHAVMEKLERKYVKKYDIA